MKNIELTDRGHLLKLMAAYNKNTLAINKGGTKYWRRYKLEIMELVWGRNMQDGYNISVFKKDERDRWDSIGEINLDFNLDIAKLEPNTEDFYVSEQMGNDVRYFDLCHHNFSSNTRHI